MDATAAVGAFNINNDKPATVLPILSDNTQVWDDGTYTGAGLTWSAAGKSDDAGNGPFTSNPQTTSGTLTFDSAIGGPFVISLKGSNTFSLYYFDASFANVTSIDFDMIGAAQNKQGKSQDLSHASLFTAGGKPTGVPSPTAALAGLGLLGLIASRRRRG